MFLAILADRASSGLGATLWQLFYVLFMFALVVLLCVLVVRLWVKKGNPWLAGSGKNLQLLEFLPLGTGKGLYLLRVPDAIWLVGVTEQGISLLQEYAPDQPLAAGGQAEPTLRLPSWLLKFWPRSRGLDAAQSTAAEASSTGFSEELLRRIEQLKGQKE